MTTVISVRGNRFAELMADKSFAYVGRSVPRTPWGNSIWGNPFKPGMTVEEVRQKCRLIRAWGDLDCDLPLSADPVRMYARYVQSRPFLLGQVHTLKGRRLGCWCVELWTPGDPGWPCHACILAALAEGKEVPL